MTTYKPVRNKGFAWGIALSIFVVLVTAVPVAISLASGKPNPGFITAMGLVFVFVTAMVGYFTWASRNMEYILDENGLVIKWAFNKKKIPLESIKGFRRAVGTSSLKVVGASWPGFHLGSFTDPAGRGSVNLFATRLWGDILLIRTKWEVVGITPEDPDQFLDELNRLLPGLEADSGTGAEQPVQPFSPWKDRLFLTVMGISAVIIIGTAIFLLKTIPTLPAKIPMHYNLAGEVDRYGSPREIFIPFGIGVLTMIFMVAITSAVARNNKTSAYMMAFVSLFISLIFSIIAISMTVSF